jgi:hypothetical protein
VREKGGGAVSELLEMPPLPQYTIISYYLAFPLKTGVKHFTRQKFKND